MGFLICADIELVAVNGFIDPYAPEDYRRMVPVLRDHFARVDDSLFFPGFITDILPARDLRKYEKSDLIASVYEMM